MDEPLHVPMRSRRHIVGEGGGTSHEGCSFVPHVGAAWTTSKGNHINTCINENSGNSTGTLQDFLICENGAALEKEMKATEFRDEILSTARDKVQCGQTLGRRGPWIRVDLDLTNVGD